VFSNFWPYSDRKQLVESKLEHTQLTGTRGGLCGWIQLKVWQYNVTSALYMLDWWEGLLFNIFMGSVFTGIVLSLGGANMQTVWYCVRWLGKRNVKNPGVGVH
tara:strand:- start:89 stop:397 length:309 start_codon:yes stop_codon:yes gene_type:complete